MDFLFIGLIIVFGVSILITVLSIKINITAMDIVNDMGMGYNLANTFDSYSDYKEINSPEEQITLWGNKVPTKELFIKIKQYGFKTIRFPVTWLHFIDEAGKVNPEWMCRVKEVVDWIIKEKMYCILNIHYDGKKGFWLSKGVAVKDRFKNLWHEISNEFKNYNKYLIFESMNDIEYDNGNYDYLTLVTLTQAFIDTVRNSGGKNGDRLLILSGANKDFDLTCSKDYKMPIDPSNKFAISIHYYLPSPFTIENDDEPWEGVTPMTEWGTENSYKEMFTYFQTMKEYYIDKGIPIVITETGVVTEQKKEPKSIRDFLFFEFSLAMSSNGIMACLFDNSDKENGGMNFYDRENDKWFDEGIGENFKKIYQEKFPKPTDYFILSNRETVTTCITDGNMKINIGLKKVMKVIFNVKITAEHTYSVGYGLCTNDKNGKFSGRNVFGESGTIIQDGTYTYNIDVSNEDFNSYVEIQKWWGQSNATLNYLTLEYDKKYTIFDFNSYKKNL